MSSRNYRIALWSSVIGTLALVVLGMIWIASGAYQKPVYTPGVNEITADDHVTGKTDASVTVVEYADYECPACGAFYTVLKKLEEDYGDRVRFVFRNLPIPGHVNGLPAAYAAEAAALQGKFSEMQDKLFSNQAQWAVQDPFTFSDTLDSYAQAIGLDAKRFKADSLSQAVKSKVDKDAKSGVKSGVDYTPTFFLNGLKVQLNSISYDEFSAKLNEALRAK